MPVTSVAAGRENMCKIKGQKYQYIREASWIWRCKYVSSACNDESEAVDPLAAGARDSGNGVTAWWNEFVAANISSLILVYGVKTYADPPSLP